MICETCHGSGKVMRNALPVFGVIPGDPDKPPRPVSIWEPCTACGGWGITHCCEGERPGNCGTHPVKKSGRAWGMQGGRGDDR